MRWRATCVLCLCAASPCLPSPLPHPSLFLFLAIVFVRNPLARKQACKAVTNERVAQGDHSLLPLPFPLFCILRGEENKQIATRNRPSKPHFLVLVIMSRPANSLFKTKEENKSPLKFFLCCLHLHTNGENVQACRMVFFRPARSFFQFFPLLPLLLPPPLLYEVALPLVLLKNKRVALTRQQQQRKTLFLPSFFSTSCVAVRKWKGDFFLSSSESG